MESRLGLTFILDGTGDLKSTVGPEDVLHYIYAILHSPAYRLRYASFLKRDFPKVPLTTDQELFRTLAAIGAELERLHLFSSASELPSITRYPISGENKIQGGYPKFLDAGEPEPGTGKPLEEPRIYINSRQYFEGAQHQVWEFEIGSYRVCEKWLKDRRGRQLSYEELNHYQKVILVLSETIRLMEQIDESIPSWPVQ
jgi:hypothetical protein